MTPAVAQYEQVDEVRAKRQRVLDTACRASRTICQRSADSNERH